MNTATVTLFACLVAFLGQETTIDATGPIRARVHEITSGSAGGIGRKLPLTITIRFRDVPSNGADRAKVEFTIVNSGDSNIDVPISPNPGDFEPKDERKTYTLLELHAFLATHTGEGIQRDEKTFGDGVHLYGDRTVPSSIVTLPPGSSIHVLAFAANPQHQQISNPKAKVIAHVVLIQETVTIVGVNASGRANEIGSAISEEYSIANLPM
jgi:hypothetical protein